MSQADIGFDKAAWFAEFELRKGLIGRRFRVTSEPRIPARFHPNILPIEGPIP